MRLTPRAWGAAVPSFLAVSHGIDNVSVDDSLDGPHLTRWQSLKTLLCLCQGLLLATLLSVELSSQDTKFHSYLGSPMFPLGARIDVLTCRLTDRHLTPNML